LSELKKFLNNQTQILELNHQWESDTKIIFMKEEENGFSIFIEEYKDEILLELDNGYHLHFEKNSYESYHEIYQDIFGLLRDLLSKHMRIKVIYKKENPIKWALEYYEKNEWQEESVMGIFSLNIFSKKIEKIYTNNILPPRELN
jgi:hypothetical protein